MFVIDYDTEKSIRGAFGETLVELGKNYPNLVVLDSDVSSSTQTKLFAKEFPERFFNMGIAEQDMIATAAGLALTGKIAFAATFAVFATGRTYDQIRSSVCYQKANVKIIGTHGGITVGEDGATHQALEDISLMRGLPNMMVIVPADCNECRQAVKFAAEYNGPVYVRIPRNNLPDIYPENYEFNPYRAVVMREGTDITIVSNGDVLKEVLKAVDELCKTGISAEVVSLPVVKPFDYQTLIRSAEKTSLVVTVENHSINGGLGSAVCEVLSEKLPTKVVRLGVHDTFGQSGTPKELLSYYKLDSKSISSKIMEIL
ncbi:MAG: transketolase family protein [bacterium]|nr:transketolase family protein [bacterium]